MQQHHTFSPVVFCLQVETSSSQRLSHMVHSFSYAQTICLDQLFIWSQKELSSYSTAAIVAKADVDKFQEAPNHYEVEDLLRVIFGQKYLNTPTPDDHLFYKAKK